MNIAIGEPIYFLFNIMYNTYIMGLLTELNVEIENKIFVEIELAYRPENIHSVAHRST